MYLTVAIAKILPSETLNHIQVAFESLPGQETGTSGSASPSVRNASDSRDAIYFWAGLPPVPSGLVKKIQLGEFIDMTELTIDRLSKPSQAKLRPVVSIVEWTQCFANYISIQGRAQPEKVPNLLSYEYLILEAHLEYAGDGWAAYDRQFHQIAAP